MRMAPLAARGFGARLALLAAALLVLTLAGCSRPREAPIAAGERVLVLGDSISAGYGVRPEQAWPVLLASETGWSIINAGVSGHRTTDGLARLPALLDEHAPHAVIVELGGNDMLRGVAESQIVANLESILAMVRERKARPILIAVPRPSAIAVALSSLAPAEFYERVADEAGAPLVSRALSAVLSDPSNRLDPLHPNAAGHRELARRFAAEMRELGLVP